MLSELLKLIDDYMNGSGSAKDMQTWILVNGPTIDASGDVRLQHLADTIEGNLIFYGVGDITNEEFNAELVNLRKQFRIAA